MASDLLNNMYVNMDEHAHNETITDNYNNITIINVMIMTSLSYSDIINSDY